MTKILKALLIIFIGFVAVLFLILYLVYGAWYTDGNPANAEVFPETEYSDISLGPYRIHIKKSYLYLKDELKGGVQEYVHIAALLPDISPRTLSNQHEFRDRWSAGRTNVKIVIRYAREHPPLSRAEWLKFLFEHDVPRDSSPQENGEIGLLSYPVKPGLRQELFTSTKDKPLFILECTKYGDDGGPPINPDCHRSNFEVAENLYATYSYPHNYLRSWKEVDAAVLKFIESILVRAGHE